MDDKAREDLIKMMIQSEHSEKKLDELLDILIEEKFALRYLSQDKEKPKIMELVSDKVARFVGSWTFIISFAVFLGAWIILNTRADNNFDPYPFILLNLVLSLIASMQSPIIMMSQNRQADIDRKRSENEYNLNLKAEIMLEDIHIKLDKIITAQSLMTGSCEDDDSEK